MENYLKVTKVTIFVRKRKIMRGGRRIDGWQAGFSYGSGGATCEERAGAIDAMRETAERIWPRCPVEVCEER